MMKLGVLGSLLVITLLSAPAQITAAFPPLVPCSGPDCGLCDLFDLANNIVLWVLTVLIPVVAPIFLVIGGIYLLIARGNPEQYTQGKNILTATVIGLIIVYVAWVAVMTVLSFLGVAPWTGLGSWWEIQCK